MFCQNFCSYFCVVKVSQHILIYLLILSILAKPIWQAKILISFQINQDYIAKNLCENRDKPKMQCNGHCQLFKQLGETQSPKNSIFQKNIALDLEVYCQKWLAFDIPKQKEIAFENKIKYPIRNTDFVQEPFLMAIFHPPQISLS